MNTLLNDIKETQLREYVRHEYQVRESAYKRKMDRRGRILMVVAILLSKVGL